MKLTKATENGFNLWVVEHKGQGDAKLRLMFQADAKSVDLTNPDDRNMIAGRLREMRCELRDLAALQPPTN